MALKGAWEKLRSVRGGPWLAAGIVLLALLSLMWQEPTQSGGASPQEARVAQVLSRISGAGKVEVALYYTTPEKRLWEEETQKAPVGAVIVARGGDDIGVRLRLIRAASTLLGLSTDKICVFTMQEGE